MSDTTYPAHPGFKAHGPSEDAAKVIEGMAATLRDQVAVCIDCGIDTVRNREYYMLHDAVWLEANPDGMLCVVCVERRLERQLRPSDFVDMPVNCTGDPDDPKSARLLSRMTGIPVIEFLKFVKFGFVDKPSTSDGTR
jgi:hypothetical protein